MFPSFRSRSLLFLAAGLHALPPPIPHVNTRAWCHLEHLVLSEGQQVSAEHVTENNFVREAVVSCLPGYEYTYRYSGAGGRNCDFRSQGVQDAGGDAGPPTMNVSP